MEGRRFDEIARTFAKSFSRREALRRFGAVAAGAGLALLGRGRTEAAACRGEGAVCREHANCCSGTCGPKNQTGRRTCICDAGEALCNGKCCPVGFCEFCPAGGCGPGGGEICTYELPGASTGQLAATETLWKAVFESEALAPAISAIGFAAVAGHRFQLHIAGRGTSSTLVDCEVVEVEYPTRLVFRWQTDAMMEPATAAVTLLQTDSGPRIAVDRVGGDPASCDVATTLLGRRWQKALLSEALPKYLERMRPE